MLFDTDLTRLKIKKWNNFICYMVLSVLPFINPSLGRLGFPGLVVGLLIMVGLIIYEGFNNKVFRPYLIGLPAYVGIYAFFLFVINADQWRTFWWMFF